MSVLLALLLAYARSVDAKHLLLIGETGAGKSTLGNKMLGKEAFKVGHDLKSCTTQSQTQFGNLFGGDLAVEVTDTGGLGDSEGRDENFVKNVAQHVRSHGGFDGILYVHNACVPRITKGAQNAMLEMLHTLADDANRGKLWQHFGIVLTQCAMYHPVYTAQLPNELRKRFPELDFDVPLFRFLQGKGVEETAFSAMSNMWGNWVHHLPVCFKRVVETAFSAMSKMWGTSFEDQITSWVHHLPDGFKLPSETKREELKRKFEENREQEKRRTEELEDRNVFWWFSCK